MDQSEDNGKADGGPLAGRDTTDKVETLTPRPRAAGKRGPAEGTAAPLLRFPLARTRPPSRPGGREYEGPSPMAQALGAPIEQTTGHWCSHCQAIWYGYLLEVECPLCGNRNG